MVSCKATRTVDKNMDFDESANTETRIVKRASDTLYYTVPKFKYKDTTITTISRENTVLSTRYNNQGQIETIMCIPPEILEYFATTNSRKEVQESKTTEVEWRTLDWFYLGSIGAIFLLLLIKLPRLK